MSRIALITGATSGIGKATAELFAGAGIDLILCGRRQERLDEVSAELSSKVNVTTLVFDVRDKGAVIAMIGSLPDDWKNIDILVNNAGNAHGMGSLAEGDTEDWDAMIDGNVKGLLYVSKAVIPLMLEKGAGHIVNISSIAGKQTYVNGAVYCASKAAVEVLSEGMRLDLTQHGIKVTNVAPGAVETEFSLVRFKGDESRAEKVYQGFDPLQAVDIADAILYAVNAPSRVTIADITILAAAQSAATTIHRK
ncbi:SDR family NAD(P)-dependent oxidoreductase [Dyadobacter chenhuakuii]|uniref:SDR family NAD(P)-dependent oxidoreductase n=1 Tax=Dyadobacter chenhuakuii TaxID=2909339 RepID=A0A9X1TV97_9BACT|nr:SDR family NAD(P)-dependent oxidoreductase [Dyadobacter chenhuakuii]MCF2495709.1 SDR family NAD(P)-dependent oxidoreductase [Dyadobacter chenhuakuii]MCF2499837.1 SDR family NAD(P)-dependent oxidoreductase [Dyadobacter chenhuakuii]USJ29741.1 SDR family NAD(P)-dependent oxidoreductase [Dyadobacter chenhuakuii]